MANSKNDNDNELIEMAELFQTDCHSTVKRITQKSPLPNVTNATFVWMFARFAEQELRIRKLEEKLNQK